MTKKDNKARFAYQSAGSADPRGGQTVQQDDLGYKSSKSRHEAHTADSKHGMGDYSGTGQKAKIGRMRSNSVGYRPVNKKQLGTPPKQVV